jgi:hypothetical protein
MLSFVGEMRGMSVAAQSCRNAIIKRGRGEVDRKDLKFAECGRKKEKRPGILGNWIEKEEKQ